MEPTLPPDYLTVRIVPELGLLQVCWLRGVNSAEYRQGTRFVQQLILDKGIRLWYSDSRQLTHVTFADQQWILKEILPELLESKLQKFARVVKTDVFSYITFEDLIRRAQQTHRMEGRVEQFTTTDSALSWLLLPD